MLQWGRSLIPAESRFKAIIQLLHVVASMGPQFNPCGKQIAKKFARDWLEALQWGRSLIPAEGIAFKNFTGYCFRFNGAAV